MELTRSECLKLYNNFVNLFVLDYDFNDNEIVNLEIKNTTLTNNKLKIFFKLIGQILETKFIEYEDYRYYDSSLLSIIFNQEIINKTVGQILIEIRKWLKNRVYWEKQYREDMETLLLVINDFTDNQTIEINIIKVEQLELVFKEQISNKVQDEFNKVEFAINENDYETAANKIESLYVNIFAKHLLKLETVNKKDIINVLVSKNKIIKNIISIEEVNCMFNLISTIRNGIKDKEIKKSNKQISKIIRNNFWEESSISDKEKKAFLKLYVDFSKTLFNFLIHNSEL